MPNTTGGKNYKKSKHSSGVEAPQFIDRQDDQMYARVTKNMGDRNMLAYCNDNRVRLCHIRGSMRKRVWINVGDIVLVSLREFEKDISESGKTYERGDIIAKYDIANLGRLRKMPDINKKLFMQLETMDGTVLAELGKKESEGKNMLLMPEEDGFEFEHEDKTQTAATGTRYEEESDDGEGSEGFDIDKI